MKSLFDLTGKVIAITGGYGHLGGAMVEGLLDHHALVIVLARSQEKFDQRFRTLENPPLFIETDINNVTSVKRSAQLIAERFGRLDGLINNAFSLEGGYPPDDMPDEIFLSALTGSLLSAYRLTRELLVLLRKSNSACIINVSSMYGMVAPDFSIYEAAPSYTSLPHYGAAKAGLLQLSRYFASWLGPEHIRVNALTPGPFPSPEVAKNNQFIEALKKKTALKRTGEPVDLQGAVVWLCSDSSSFVTGQNIVIDGGWTIV